MGRWQASLPGGCRPRGRRSIDDGWPVHALRAMALVTVLAAMGCPPSYAQHNAATAPPAKAVEVAMPAADRADVEEPKRKRAEVEASEELGKSLKKTALGLLDKAIRFREMSDQINGEVEAIAQKVEAAPERLKEIKAELDRPIPSLDRVIDLAAASRMETGDIEQQMRQEEAELANAKAALTQLSDQLGKQRQRPQQLPEDAARARTRLEEIRRELEAAPAPDEHALVTEARRESLLAEKAKCKAEMNLYTQLEVGHDVLVSLLSAEHDLAALEVARREARVKAWQSAVRTRHQQEATRARADAVTAKLQASDLPPAVKEQFDLNIALGEKLETLTREDAALLKKLERRRTELKTVEEEFALARERVASIVVTEAMGLALQEQRKSLPSHGGYRQDSAARQLKMSEVRDAQLDIDRQRQELADLDAATDRVLGSLGLVKAAELDPLRTQIRAMLGDRRDLLERLQAGYHRYFKNLQSLEFTEQRLATEAEEFGDFLDGHLLWLRSAKPIGLRDLRDLPTELGWILAPGLWWRVIRDLWLSFSRGPLWWILGLLLGSALVGGRRRARAELAEVAKRVAPLRTDSFTLTLRALAATLCLAAGWPFLMAFVGWQLLNLPFAGDFTRAFSSALLRPALHLGIMGFLYHMCRDDGLARIHFRWPAAVVTTIRHNLLWFLPSVLPLVFLTRLAETASNPEYYDTIGRLAALALMVVLSCFLARTFRLSGGVVATLVEANPDGWPARFRYIWYPLAVGLPLVSAALAAYGYVYTSLVLLLRLYASFWVVFLVILAGELGLRWLFIAKRRLVSYRAKRKREAARQAASGRQAEGRAADAVAVAGDQPIAIEEPEVGFDQIDEQTRSLLRIIVLFSALLGLWNIWDPVLPALDFMENVKLWSYRTDVDGMPKTLPITLSNLLIAIVAVTVTVVAARNLPGVLEITLLNRLRMDPGARYAFTTICRYVIFAVGIIVALSTFGFSWSSLQWLVAALSVGLGFGLQEIVANFVSGLIVLFERPYRLGDTVTIGDVTGTVSRIRIRATTITDWDRHELIVPNKEFITGRLINWSLTDPITRVILPVGIAYGSDTALTERLLMKVARENPVVLDQPAPSVLFSGFGDNSLNFELRVFVGGINDFIPVKHQLHLAIDREFRQAGITIAFPQRDVHLDISGPLDVRVVSGPGGVQSRRPPAESKGEDPAARNRI